MQDIGGRKGFFTRVQAVLRTPVCAGIVVVVLLGTVWVATGGKQLAGASYGPSYCSGYRWNVKTGQDPQANQVNLASVTKTTVGYLTSLPPQPSLSDSTRFSPTELTQYEVTGTIVDIVPPSSGHDGDYHVVIQDSSSNNVMITEIPDPACVPTTSPFAAMSANARSVFVNTANPLGKMVTIRGVGFFDSNTLTSS